MIIGFSKPKNKKFPIFSWIIRLVLGTPYSHVYIKFYSKKFDRWLVYQASGTNVHFIEWNRFNKQAETVKEFDIECSQECRDKVVQKAIDFAGAPYGIKRALGILVVKIARCSGKDMQNPFSDGEATWVCSQIVYELIEELDIDIGISKDNITPKDIEQYLSNRTIS